MPEFVKVAETDQVPPGKMFVVPNIDRVDICLLNLNGKYYAFSGVCTHKGGPLYKGTLRDKYVSCPWHSAAFNVETGKEAWPADRRLRTFDVRVEGTSLYLNTTPVQV